VIIVIQRDHNRKQDSWHQNKTKIADPEPVYFCPKRTLIVCYKKSISLWYGVNQRGQVAIDTFYERERKEMLSRSEIGATDTLWRGAKMISTELLNLVERCDQPDTGRQ
jgi:hypothetical protein